MRWCYCPLIGRGGGCPPVSVHGRQARWLTVIAIGYFYAQTPFCFVEVLTAQCFADVVSFSSQTHWIMRSRCRGFAS